MMHKLEHTTKLMVYLFHCFLFIKFVWIHVVIYNLTHDVMTVFNNYVNCLKYIESMSEIRVMPAKLQFAVFRASLVF